MRYCGYKKGFVTVAALAALALFALAGCGEEPDTVLTEKVNAVLRSFECEEIRPGSRQEISRQLTRALQEMFFEGSGRAGYIAGLPQTKIRVAELLVENGLYETAGRLFRKYPSHNELVVFVALMTDALPEKSAEAVEFMKLFYQEIQEKKWKKALNNSFPYLLLYEKSPEILEKIHFPENSDNPSVNGRTFYLWVSGAESVFRLVQKSSDEFKKAIIEQLSIQYSIPSSIAGIILEDSKPSSPQKGKFVLVIDDEPHKLEEATTYVLNIMKRHPSQFYGVDSGYFTFTVCSRPLNDYKKGILEPARHFNEAHIIIYETYSYEKQFEYNGNIYVRNTNVKAVDTITGKTIFDKTFITIPSNSYTVWADNFDKFLFDDKYRRREYAEQISEIIEKD